MRHNYAVCLRRLREEEGGGFVATLPQLGIGTFSATGESPAEALDSLDMLYAELQLELEQEGYLFPEPRDERDLSTGLSLLEMVEWSDGGGCLPYPPLLKRGFRPVRPRQMSGLEREIGAPENKEG